MLIYLAFMVYIIADQEVKFVAFVLVVDHRCLICDEVLRSLPMVYFMTQRCRHLDFTIRVIKKVLLQIKKDKRNEFIPECEILL